MPRILPGAQNWIVDPKTKPIMAGGQPPASPNPGAGALPPGITSTGDGITRTVQDNELMGTHMAALGNADNRILRQARQRGALAGASRGGINSNLAAATGEQAWLDAAGSVAAQQAGAYGTAAGQNLSSLSSQRIASEGNAAQLGAAGISASASMYGADADREVALARLSQDRDLTLSGREFQTSERTGEQDFRRGERIGDQEYRTGERVGDQEYRSRESQANRDFQHDETVDDFNRQVAGGIFREFLGNPEEWDEDTMTGAINFFNQFMNPDRNTRP